MKKLACLSVPLILAGSLCAADPTPKDNVTAAARKLGDQSSYSWKQTVVVPEDMPFKPGPTEGKLEKGGVTYFTFSFGEATTKIFLKGADSAINGPDGDWRSAKELEGEEGPGRFVSSLVKAFRPPDKQATELADAAKELKPEGDAISSELTDEGAKKQFRFGNVTNPKGAVKFWIKDGQLTKYRYKLTGKAEFNGNEFDVDRETTVEISAVGTTKVEVPAEAKKKLEPAPAPAADPAKKDK